ncbi:hypothetical protein Glove_278g43 [Diversispora epigaea]|uniref:Uncharacterized protein n=1 Tax=Diversispora epigaea TaxID=1348612 RepID=A0A397I498_9GLOM|nr:hypothetical protein Glove_278g43 [Diversispora epigaea]
MSIKYILEIEEYLMGSITMFTTWWIPLRIKKKMEQIKNILLSFLHKLKSIPAQVSYSHVTIDGNVVKASFLRMGINVTPEQNAQDQDLILRIMESRHNIHDMRERHRKIGLENHNNFSQFETNYAMSKGSRVYRSNKRIREERRKFSPYKF